MKTLHCANLHKPWNLYEADYSHEQLFSTSLLIRQYCAKADICVKVRNYKFKSPEDAQICILIFCGQMENQGGSPVLRLKEFVFNPDFRFRIFNP